MLATHGKYAPSQSEWLLPLDDLVSPDVLRELAPRAVDLCRFDARVALRPPLHRRAGAVVAHRPPRGAAPHLGRRRGRTGRVRVHRPGVGPLRAVLRAGGRGRRLALRRRVAADAGHARGHRCGRAAPAARPAGARGPPHLALRRRRRRAARRAGGDGRSVAGRHRSHPSERARRALGARARTPVAGPTPAATGGPSRAPVATSPPRSRSSSSSRVARGGRDSTPHPARSPPTGLRWRPTTRSTTSTPSGSPSPRRRSPTACSTYPPLRRFPEVEDAGWGAIHEALARRAVGRRGRRRHAGRS